MKTKNTKSFASRWGFILASVGSAVGANPLHVIIPCHRVVEKSGRIGGYAGGGAVKFELLAREGKVVSVNAVPGRGFTRLIADAIPKVMG